MQEIVERLQPAVPRLVEAHQRLLEHRLAAALGIVFEPSGAEASRPPP